MAKDSIQLTAQLYPVAREFKAEVGQQVMIVAGVCVGVFTGTLGVPVQTSQRLSHDAEARQQEVDRLVAKVRRLDEKAAEQQQPKRKHSRPSVPKGAKADGSPMNTLVPIMDKLLQIVAMNTGIHRKEIDKLIPVEIAGVNGWRTRDSLAWLTVNKYVTVGAGRVYHKGPNFRPMIVSSAA